jgi:hypothetical protein
MYGSGVTINLKTGGGTDVNLDGRNYPVPPNPNCSGSACRTTASMAGAMPGLYTPAASATVTGNPSFLQGDPPQKVGGGIHTGEEWADFVNKVLSDPASYQTGGTGTRAAPVITVVESGSTLQVNTNGAGLVIVKDGGSFILNGSTVFEGVIVLMGNNSTATLGGASILYGTLVTIDHTSKTLNLSGTSFHYSSQAVGNISGMGNLKRFQRVSWREIH